jgi:hypothetical protein
MFTEEGAQEEGGAGEGEGGKKGGKGQEVRGKGATLGAQNEKKTTKRRGKRGEIEAASTGIIIGSSGDNKIR